MNNEKEIIQRAQVWARPPFNKETMGEVSTLLRENNIKELTERFYRSLEFGTGGLRGIIGAGTNRMNHYTVGLATQGLANYIKKETPGGHVVIARDSRRKSPEFSRRTAEVLAGNGIRVSYFNDVAPTPFCSYAIRKLGASAGVVITASHNPPEYNGYKVYWSDGGQIVPPRDAEIIDEVSRVTDITTIKSLPFEEGVANGMIKIIGDEITDAYMSDFKTFTSPPPGRESLKILYTPIHGSGYCIIPRLFEHFGFSSAEILSSQETPDGDFPTVSSPNPEEPAAMKLALDHARSTGADLVLATDPDADRMGVAVRGPDGDFLLLNGNQIGTLLEKSILQRRRENGDLPVDGRIVKTIVTTELQKKIAHSYNCHVDEVLTGFKWIADKMKDYDDTGEGSFIFGGEESYGYLGIPFVRDKDAVSSCYFFAEMAAWLADRGMSVYDFLLDIYREHGLFLESLVSLTLKGIEGVEKIRAIMNYFRTTPPESIRGKKITRACDFQSLEAKNFPAGSIEKITGLPASNVLQYELDGGGRITMRPSGTEPKIKFYFSLSSNDGKDNMEAAIKNLKEEIKELEQEILKMIEDVS